MPVDQRLSMGLLGLISLCCLYVYLRWPSRKRRNLLRLPLPPGPKGLPLIGNIRDIPGPDEDESEAYHKLARQYGEIMSLMVFGQPIIVLNSAKVANDLFEKRSANYSDRIRLVMINELMGYDWSFAMMPYGERWRHHRKTFHQQFQPSMCPTFWPLQTKEAHFLLHRVLQTPWDMEKHLRLYAGATIMSVVYGLDISDTSDRYLEVAERSISQIAQAGVPGTFLVDMLPWLKYIPSWVPGAKFQQIAKEWSEVAVDVKEIPFQAVTHAFENGAARPSFASNLLEELRTSTGIGLKVDKEQEDVIKSCAAVAYAAGADTTVAAIRMFILAMVKNQGAQRKAQVELDQYLGGTRLPELSDRSALPYVDALLKETQRWNPVSPMGFAHMATNDDEYDGYFIPGGSIIIGFTWEILHDPATYPDPYSFKPERFVATPDHTPEPDPAQAAFGYGRRMCPGRHMADDTLWIVIASFLSVFDILPVMDIETGKPKIPNPKYTPGTVKHPLPFDYQIIPRSKTATALIVHTADMHA